MAAACVDGAAAYACFLLVSAILLILFSPVPDGEEAMRGLEAAQVKMEEKLNYMTNFIDQELQKVRENPVRLVWSF